MGFVLELVQTVFGHRQALVGLIEFARALTQLLFATTRITLELGLALFELIFVLGDLLLLFTDVGLDVLARADFEILGALGRVTLDLGHLTLGALDDFVGLFFGRQQRLLPGEFQNGEQPEGPGGDTAD